MSKLANGLNSTAPVKSQSPRVFYIKSEKKLKLENNSNNMSENGMEDVEATSKSNSLVVSKPVSSKGTDLLENSSSLWTSTENSFVQVTEKLLHRGIQTDYLNNNHILMGNLNANLSTKAPSNSSNLNAPAFEMVLKDKLA